MKLKLSLVLSLALMQINASADPALVVLRDSVHVVDAAPAAGVATPHAYISRSSLQGSELAADLNFEFALKMRNLSELQSRLARGNHISRQEMASRYLPLASDEKTLADWITSKGLTITRRDSSHLAIFARGSISQIQSVLQVSFARVTFGGKEYTSAITAPSVPANLASLMVGINGLQPHLQPHTNFKIAPSSGLARVASGAALKPGSGSLKPGSVDVPYVAPFTPGDIAKAYNATGLYTAGVKGAGQSIAIVIDTFPNTSDLTTFWSECGISQSLGNFTFTQVVSGTLPAPSGEETLDTEWSSSIAPAAKVRVYAAQSLAFTALDQCYAQVLSDVNAHPEYGLHQMSMSYGIPENLDSGSQLDTDAQYFASLTAAGVTVLASSGDQGANPDPRFGENVGLSPEDPSCDPNVTGVGGTALTLDSNGNPLNETVWNDSIINGDGVYWASGGGVSAHFSRPSWQTGTGVPSGSTRVDPDVSAAAAISTPAFVVLNGEDYDFGGTSWACPTWAGFCALLNQDRANHSGSSMGLLGPLIYPLIGTASFRDITIGNNGTYDVAGYTAASGYDLCTGIGTPNIATLSQTLSGGALPPIVTSLASEDGTAGKAFSYQVSGTNFASSYALTGTLPPGLSFSTSTGILSGTPTQTGNYSLTMAATNSTGTGTAPLVINVFASSNVQLFVADALASFIGDYTGTGAAISPDFISGLQAPTAMTSSGSDIFVFNYYSGAIDEYTTSGATVKTSLVTGLGTIYALAATSSDIFVANHASNSIDEYTTAGALVKSGLITGLTGPVGLAISGTTLYVVSEGTTGTPNTGFVGSYTTAGAVINATLIPAGTFGDPWGIAVVGSDLLVADRDAGTIGEFTTAGATVNASFLTGFQDPWGIAVAGTDIFVTDDDEGTIGEYTTSGTTVNAALVSGLNLPLGLVAVTQSGPQSQTITFPTIPNQVVLGHYALNATASSGLPVTYTVAGPATINGSNVLSFTGGGTVAVTAHQAGNTNYSVAQNVERVFSVAKKGQDIGFPAIPNQTYGGPTYTLNAYSTSGLPITYTFSGDCTVSGTTLTITGAGGGQVVARQAGNTIYGAAANIIRNFRIAKASQTITFPAIPNQVVGATYTLNATASSGLAVTYTVSGPASVSGTTLTVTGAGSVQVTAHQAGNTNYNVATNVLQKFTATP